jgi:type VI protein secretion system component VasA
MHNVFIALLLYFKARTIYSAKGESFANSKTQSDPSTHLRQHQNQNRHKQGLLKIMRQTTHSRQSLSLSRSYKHSDVSWHVSCLLATNLWSCCVATQASQHVSRQKPATQLHKEAEQR